MKAFKELTAEAKKKEMIRVKLKKGKKIGHVITSPGKGGKPGKVLKRKGMPGQKDVGEASSSSSSSSSPGYKMAQSKDPYTVKYSNTKRGTIKIAVVDGKKAAEKFLKAVKKLGMNGIIVKGASEQKRESVVKEGGMGGDRHFNVNKGGSIPSNAEIKAFYEKQKGSHSQRIAATKKHFGLQKMTVSANKGNVSAKGIRENEGIEKEIEEMATIDEAKTMGGILRKVKKGTPPYTVVAMVKGKVVDQQTARVASQVPAIIKEFQGGGSGATDLGSKHVGDVKIAVEDKDSRVVYSEGFTRQGMTNEGKESAAYKSNRAEYDKLLKKWGKTPVLKMPWEAFSRIRELGDSFYDTKAGSGLKVGDLLQHMKETYAPGNTTRMPSMDFDERQSTYAANYKRIHKKSPSKAEMQKAGVGKGGDNPKGVKAWKAAMMALKMKGKPSTTKTTSNEATTAKKLSYKERMKILKDLDNEIKKKGKK